MKLSYDVRVVAAGPYLVAESPLWDSAAQVLYWVDTRRPAVQRLDPATGQVSVWPMPRKLGSIALRRSGGLMAGTEAGFCALDLDSGQVTPIIDPEPHLPSNRLNDGKVDRRGRYWCGSRDSGEVERTGSLYRLDPDLSCRAMAGGFNLFNGLAISPDDRTMVFSDTNAGCTFAYDFDLDAGSITNRRVYLASDGLPWRFDGGTFDADGCYWCALIDDWSVGRFDPAGRLDRLVRLPVQHPTMCAFGGADLRTLFVTSASIFTSAEERSQQPLAGAVFAVDGLGVRGTPEPAFAG